MRQLRLLTALLLFSSAVLAQTRQITGNLKDSKSGNAIPSATIKVKGKNIHTVSNSEGTFSLDIPTGNVLLEISSVGYATKTVEVDGTNANLAILLDQFS